MTPIVEAVTATVGRGLERFLGPERFREILVIGFTGYDDPPGEMLEILIAWVLAVFVATRVYPKR